MLNKDIIVLELEEILSKPSGFFFDSWLQLGGVTQEIGINQLSLSDSYFSFKYPNKRILHFTDLNSAFLILQTKVFRARSLDSISDDSEELIYCLKLMDNFDEIIELQKKYCFVACFTPLENKTIINDFDFHWKKYGNNYKGIALEFEIICQPLISDHYSLNVNYLNSLNQQHCLFDYIKGKKINSVLLKALIPIFASIKQTQFESEKEIRLFAHFDKSISEKSHYEKNIGFTLSKDNNVNFHYDIPFILENEEAKGNLLQLKKIYIGRNAEANDGQMIILNHLLPILDENKIEHIWMD